ncbi:unnamed protein product [Triticum turgidum subsp. durum]|uniref:COBRA C-terminal domain-containing protein n=1 Tax=Triticum turgidum subsp. durum TaxID=4567 RepID=A0A9R1BEA5_TRITD|nr:unnamed protein product [Triticum turgidum subsp. durum]
MTWQVTCSYSQTAVGPFRSCCVCLSTFYSRTIVECPDCTCGACPARTSTAPQCQDAEIRCTGHMCPIRVHWHVKKRYTEYWRVKLSINNFNRFKNFTDWNLVFQHPSLQELTQVLSFAYEPLVQRGTINDTGLFWGLPSFNQMLPQDGTVQTEVLLRKGKDFSFSGGWALPRKIYFDGSECTMPPPDDFPQLPSSSPVQRFSGGHRWLASGAVLVLGLLLT